MNFSIIIRKTVRSKSTNCKIPGESCFAGFFLIMADFFLKPDHHLFPSPIFIQQMFNFQIQILRHMSRRHRRYFQPQMKFPAVPAASIRTITPLCSRKGPPHNTCGRHEKKDSQVPFLPGLSDKAGAVGCRQDTILLSRIKGRAQGSPA